MPSPSIAVAVVLSVFALAGCRDESSPPRSAGDSAGEQQSSNDTQINRTHGAVKTELQRAAEKTRQAGDSLQRDIQRGARKGADELGVRRNAAGIPARGADAGS